MIKVSPLSRHEMKKDSVIADRESGYTVKAEGGDFRWLCKKIQPDLDGRNLSIIGRGTSPYLDLPLMTAQAILPSLKTAS